MSFEIRERDLLARIGRLTTKTHSVETPILLPVVNPAIQPISPNIMKEEFGCKAIITNSYIIRKHSESKATQIGVHQLLNFDGAIMTDSGAYQTLVYGDVDTTNSEIIQFQEQIGSDIATILDLPTGWGVSQEYAKHTVEETLRRARELSRIKTRDDILWVGPIQGGVYLNLVAKAAKAMSKLPFQIYALGSPTPVMQQYLFGTLVDMVMAAKRNLPTNRPLHLFGAGHPFMFCLAVALGCDLFDSAAYAIFAREDRYLTENGTIRLNELEYLPCSCKFCSATDIQSVKTRSKTQRQAFLARHNLQVSLTEIKKVKQAIFEGTLWEYLQMRSHSHPSLFGALKKLAKHKDYLEAQSPVSKKSGIFFYGCQDLIRPEVVRYRKRLVQRYTKPKNAQILLLLPHTSRKPYHMSKEHRRAFKAIERNLGARKSVLHACTYAAPFGVVPLEIDEVYPLSQHETAVSYDSETISYVAEQVRDYVSKQSYKRVLLLQDEENLKSRIISKFKRAWDDNRVPLTIVQMDEPWSRTSLSILLDEVQKAVDSIT